MNSTAPMPIASTMVVLCDDRQHREMRLYGEPRDGEAVVFLCDCGAALPRLTGDKHPCRWCSREIPAKPWIVGSMPRVAL